MSIARPHRFAALALLGALLSCSDQRVVTPAAPVSLTVTPGSMTLLPGERATLVASIHGSTNQAVRYTSTEPLVAAVGEDGVVSALAPGLSTVMVQAVADTTVRMAVPVRVDQPSASRVLKLSPSEPVLAVGDSVALVASTAEGASVAVDYRSSDTTVARVSASGMVVARREGAAVVTAQVRTDSTHRGFVVVRVVPRSAGGLSVLSLRDSTGATVGASAVGGTIDARIRVTPATADSLQVLLGERVVHGCTTRFTAPSNETREVSCVIDTAAFDSVSGVVVFPNGSYPVMARLLGGERVLLSAGTGAVAVRNADGFMGRVSFGGSNATDSAGRVWGTGNLTVRAIPVLYGGAKGASVVVQLDVFHEGKAVRLAQSASSVGGAVTLTFSVSTPPSAGGVQGVNTGGEGVRPVLASAVLGGQPVVAPRFANERDLVLRLDNERPLPGTLTLPAASGGYVGSGYGFAAGYTRGSRSLGTPPESPVAADAPWGVEGVGGVKPVFYAAPAAMIADPANPTDAEIQAVVQRRQIVRTGADLEATETNDVFVLVAVVADALGNANHVVLPTRFGVDKEPPELEVSVPRDSVNPAEPYGFRVSDRLSGALGVQVTLTRLTEQGSACVALQPGAPPCEGVLLPPTGASFSIATQPPGYYTLEASAVDRAGNHSPIYRSPLMLLDPLGSGAPGVTSLALPSTPVGNRPATFAATVSDDVGLSRGVLRQLFANAAVTPLRYTFPLERSVRFGGYGAPVVTNGSLSSTRPFLRSLRLTTNGVPDTARVLKAVGAQVEVRDVAGNITRGEVHFLPNAVSAPGALAAGIRTFAAGVSGGHTAVCVSGEACAGAPASVELTAAITGPGGFALPFERVLFYYTDAAGALHYLGSSERLAPVVDNGQVRTWTFILAMDAPALRATLPAPGGSTSITAIGMNAQGDGLLSAAFALGVR